MIDALFFTFRAPQYYAFGWKFGFGRLKIISDRPRFANERMGDRLQAVPAIDNPLRVSRRSYIRSTSVAHLFTVIHRGPNG
jgi:hypothetical protein